MDYLKINPKIVKYYLQNLPQLVFEVTDRCNLNCKYCGYSDIYSGYDKREGKNISFNRAKVIIDYLYDLWSNDYSDSVNHELIISFYGGEPLLNVPFIKQTIEYLDSLEMRKIGRVCSYSMTTNAMLLDKYMDYLVEKDFRLLISLDGDSFGQSYRVDHFGNNSFERVFHNIMMLQGKYPEYFKSKTGFNSVLHNRNEVETIYQFIRTKFDKIPHIVPLDRAGICEEKKDEFIKIYRNPVDSFFRSNNCELIENEMFMNAPRVAQLADYILRQSGNNYQSYNELYINRDQIPFSTGTCIPFSKKMFVTVNGKILPCERISQLFSLGCVHEDRTELNENYVAERHNYYLSKFSKQCANCASNKFCSLCVYQVDDICTNDPCCHIFLSYKELECINEDSFKYLQEHQHYYRKILEEVKISR